MASIATKIARIENDLKEVKKERKKLEKKLKIIIEKEKRLQEQLDAIISVIEKPKSVEQNNQNTNDQVN